MSSAWVEGLQGQRRRVVWEACWGSLWRETLNNSVTHTASPWASKYKTKMVNVGTDCPSTLSLIIIMAHGGDNSYNQRLGVWNWLWQWPGHLDLGCARLTFLVPQFRVRKFQGRPPRPHPVGIGIFGKKLSKVWKWAIEIIRFPFSGMHIIAYWNLWFSDSIGLYNLTDFLLTNLFSISVGVEVNL